MQKKIQYEKYMKNTLGTFNLSLGLTYENEAMHPVSPHSTILQYLLAEESWSGWIMDTTE